MAKKKLYQVGIYPNCPTQTRQQLEFAANECSGDTTDRGRPNLYGEVHTLSLFRCNGCTALLLYKTHFEDVVEADRAEKLDPKWIFELDDFGGDSDFRDHSSLLYATHPVQEAAKPNERALSDHAPDEIKRLYEIALKARNEPNSFAVQIRRALEGICKGQGEPGRNLNDDLIKLSQTGVFPPIVAEIAHELRDIGNVGAHVKSRDVEAEQVQAIDDFFHLVITYVYEAPARLSAYRKLLTPELPEIALDDTVN